MQARQEAVVRDKETAAAVRDKETAAADGDKEAAAAAVRDRILLQKDRGGRLVVSREREGGGNLAAGGAGSAGEHLQPRAAGDAGVAGERVLGGDGGGGGVAAAVTDRDSGAVEVVLEVEAPGLGGGERVYVCGEHAAVGAWKVEEALLLSPPPNPRLAKRWSGQVC
jgi:hypothetical protein